MTTRRLGFRYWSNDDFPLAIALWGDSQVTALIGGPFSPETIRQRIEKEQGYWPIFLLATGDHVGCAGVRPYHPEQKIFELGFHLLPKYWHQGLAQEAARAVIDYAFDTLGARALFAGHHPANQASQRTLTKLGFVYTHNEFYGPTGLRHPSYLLTSTNHEPTTTN